MWHLFLYQKKYIKTDRKVILKLIPVVRILHKHAYTYLIQVFFNFYRGYSICFSAVHILGKFSSLESDDQGLNVLPTSCVILTKLLSFFESQVFSIFIYLFIFLVTVLY